jgi:hypothetical protein
MKKFFILRDDGAYELMRSFIAANWKTCASADAPLAVAISPYKPSRTLEQNNLMWALLEEVSQQGWVAKRKFSSEVWHEHFKKSFLPDVNSKGDLKWTLLPDGSRICTMSTTRLNTQEMSDYLSEIIAFATTELGVKFHEKG